MLKNLELMQILETKLVRILFFGSFWKKDSTDTQKTPES